MSLLQAGQLPQALVFTGDGIRLTGHVLHFRDSFLQHLIFRFQRFITEHIAVVLLRRGSQSGAGCPEGGQHTLDNQVRDAGIGDAAGNGQGHGQQSRNDQDDLHPGRKQISHRISSISSGARFRSVCPRRHTGSPITL